LLINLSVLGLLSTIAYQSNTLVLPPADNFEVTVSDGHSGTQVVTLNPF
jgi:hypothetical protein